MQTRYQVPIIRTCSSCFSRVFQAPVSIATCTYGMSVPSLHTESTDYVIAHTLYICTYMYTSTHVRVTTVGKAELLPQATEKSHAKKVRIRKGVSAKC